MPRSWNILDWVRQGSEQPDVVEAVPACCRGLDYVIFESAFQPKPFCNYSQHPWNLSIHHGAVL